MGQVENKKHKRLEIATLNSYYSTYSSKYSSTVSDEFEQPEAEEPIGFSDEKVLNQTQIKKYFQDLYKIPLLLQSEELELARSYREAHNKQNEKEVSTIARNKLVLGNLRLVVGLAKKYANSRMELAELIQEGNLGLLKAAEKYDPEMGYRFSTYATWWIRQAILSGINEKSRIIRLPASVNELLSKIRRTKEDLPKLLGREATMKEICEVLEVPQARISTVLNLEELQDQIVSLDNTYQSEDSTETSLLDTICHEQDRLLEDEIDHKIMHEFIETAIEDSLNIRETLIVRMRYGLNAEDKTMTLTELARIMKISVERVRQIELKALTKLKSYISSSQFGDK